MEKTKEVLHAAKEKASDILAPNVTGTEHEVRNKVAQTTKEGSQERFEILKRAEAAYQQLKQAPGGGSAGTGGEGSSNMSSTSSTSSGESGRAGEGRSQC